MNMTEEERRRRVDFCITLFLAPQNIFDMICTTFRGLQKLEIRKTFEAGGVGEGLPIIFDDSDINQDLLKDTIKRRLEQKTGRGK